MTKRGVNFLHAVAIRFYSTHVIVSLRCTNLREGLILKLCASEYFRKTNFKDTKEFHFIKKKAVAQAKKVFREIIIVKALCFGCQQSFSTRRWVQGFCLFCKLRISQRWNEIPLSFSSHQCTGVNTQSCSRFSWSCRVRTASSVSCGPPPSWPTTTPTTASPARRPRSTTWKKCRGAISPSPGRRSRDFVLLLPALSLGTLSSHR